MPKGPFLPSEFVPTKFSSAQDKADFGNAFLRFIESEWPRTAFSKSFYNRLSMCFSHIAHYDAAGFYETWFTSDSDRLKFLRHYSVFRTMPSDLESMCTKACVCWPMLELLDQSLGIVLLSLQVVEESKEFVSGAITAKLTLQRFCLFEGFLFHRQSGFQVDLSRFDRFVPKPQCDDRAIHAALQ